jgi:hypothetical protein
MCWLDLRNALATFARRKRKNVLEKVHSLADPSWFALSANCAAAPMSDTFEFWWRHVLPEEIRGFSFPRVIYLALFILALISLYRVRKAFFRPYTTHLYDQEVQPRKHLVLFLSNLPDSLDHTDGVPNYLKDILKYGNLTEDIQLMKSTTVHPRWPWVMPLIAINKHLRPIADPSLKSVTLVCSKKSRNQAYLFFNICQKYQELRNKIFHLLLNDAGQTRLIQLPEKGPITGAVGWNFDSFEALSRACASSTSGPRPKSMTARSSIT